MICKKCNGKGYIYTNAFGTNGKLRCDVCGGNGKILSNQQTNEEWLRQANKEEMEHALTMLIMKDRYFADKKFAYVNIRFKVHKWLKEVHEDG